LRLVATMFGGRMIGAEAGSKDVHYSPAAELQAYGYDDDHKWFTDTGAVGTHCMAIQLVIPLLTFIHPTRVPRDGIRLSGGTNVKGAPLIDYASKCIAPMMKKLFGLRVDIDVNKRGWSPK
jgi:RNA 3'-terminal phosphate cyclase